MMREQKKGGNFTSPSVGMTYALFDNTLLRASVARDFNNAGLSAFISDEVAGFQANPNLQAENVWSYQVGPETTALKYLWLRATAFRNDIWDAIEEVRISDQVFTLVNSERRGVRDSR
ncbi:MAG TPA: hypothetical protein DCP92_02580 [Nitrospiraceae bacterium]|jgi:vitamin B12 transporter|nr:hypothetical protein [Nitrospiraceae bacterium]